MSSAEICDGSSTIPTKRSRTFTTAFDDQEFVGIHVLQGEREMVEDNISLANFNLIGIPPAPRGIPQIEVSFEVDADGILHVSANDLGTGKRQEIQVVTSGGLTEADIIEESKANLEKDTKRKDLAILRNEAEGLLHSVRRTLDSYGDKIDTGNIERSVEEMREAQLSEDYAYVKETLDQLKEASYKFAEAIYSKQEKFVETPAESE